MNIESNDNQSVEFPIAIPTYVENVYVKYEGVDRISIVPVQDGKIAIKAPQIQNIKSRAVINTKNSNEYGLLSINGTLMFEDMYPQLGDYDFNDFVARYNLRILYKYSRGKYYAHKMCISVQIRAVGGIYKYEPYTRLKKEGPEVLIRKMRAKNITVLPVIDADDKLVGEVRLNDLLKLRNKQEKSIETVVRTEVHSVLCDTVLEDILPLMTKSNSPVWVIDETREFLGTIPLSSLIIEVTGKDKEEINEIIQNAIDL